MEASFSYRIEVLALFCGKPLLKNRQKPHFIRLSEAFCWDGLSEKKEKPPHLSLNNAQLWGLVLFVFKPGAYSSVGAAGAS